MAKSAVKSKAKSKLKVKSHLKAKSGVKVKSALKINDMIWPMERDVLFRPDRLKYVRRLITPKGCVFCYAAKHKESLETLCLYKTQHSMIVLNKFPYNSGHLLVIPLEHTGLLLDLADDKAADLHRTLKLALRAIQHIFEPGGVNIGMNQGAVAGAGIPDHLHYHVIPRWSGDVNFFPMIAETKVVVQTLEQTYDLFLEYFKEQENWLGD